MEKEHLRSSPDLPERQNKIIYADPMDITKMLDISPGTQVLAGVGETLPLLYPEETRKAGLLTQVLRPLQCRVELGRQGVQLLMLGP